MRNPKILRIKADPGPGTALSLIKRYFPTWQQVFPVFLTILFPVTFWSVLNFSRELPSYLMRMKIWEIVGVFAYTQVFAFLESSLLLLSLIIIAELLPYPLFLKHFTTQAALISILATLWIIPLHYKTQILTIFPKFENSWASGIWLGIFVALVVGLSFLLSRYKRLERAFDTFIDKLTVVSSLYLIVDISSLLIVLIRNVVFALS
jgi:hypothetical protein